MARARGRAEAKRGDALRPDGGTAPVHAATLAFLMVRWDADRLASFRAAEGPQAQCPVGRGRSRSLRRCKTVPLFGNSILPSAAALKAL